MNFNSNRSRNYHYKPNTFPNTNIRNNPHNMNVTNKFCNYCKNKGHLIIKCRKREYMRQNQDLNAQPNSCF